MSSQAVQVCVGVDQIHQQGKTNHQKLWSHLASILQYFIVNVCPDPSSI